MDSNKSNSQTELQIPKASLLLADIIFKKYDIIFSALNIQKFLSHVNLHTVYQFGSSDLKCFLLVVVW